MPETRIYGTLKPMAAGASGFARLEGHAGGLTLQWQGKGLRCRAARAYLYAADGTLRELGACPVNAQGQASLRVTLPNRDWRAAPAAPTAIFAVSDEPAPRPLLLGLFVRETSGALLDAKNALLALCERLACAARAPADEPPAPADAEQARADEPPAPDDAEQARADEPPAPDDEPSPSMIDVRAPEQPAPLPIIRKRKRVRRWRVLHEPVPPEAYLPAIDPAVHVRADACRPPAPSPDATTAAHERSHADESMVADAPPVRRRRTGVGKPVDCLPRLYWAKPFEQLAPLFERYPPFSPFAAPGWRFVRVPMRDGFFAVGRLVRDGKVERVAYALPGTEDAPPPPGMRGYRFTRGRDGQGYWACQRDASGD